MRNPSPRPEAGQVWLAAASLPHPHRLQASVWGQLGCLPGSETPAASPQAWNRNLGGPRALTSASIFPGAPVLTSGHDLAFQPPSTWESVAFDRLCPSRGPGVLPLGVYWVHGHLWAPETQSSFLLPPNPEARHLTPIMRAGVLGQETKTVSGGGVMTSVQTVVLSSIGKWQWHPRTMHPKTVHPKTLQC